MLLVLLLLVNRKSHRRIGELTCQKLHSSPQFGAQMGPSPACSGKKYYFRAGFGSRAKSRKEM